MLPRPTVTVALVATLQLRGIQQRSPERVAALAKPPGVTTNVMAPYGTPHDHRVVPVREPVVRQVPAARVALVTKTAQAQVLQRRRVAAVFLAVSRVVPPILVVVVAAAAGIPVALQAVQEAVQVVAQAQLEEQERPTPAAAAVVVLSDVHLVALAVRAL